MIIGKMNGLINLNCSSFSFITIRCNFVAAHCFTDQNGNPSKASGFTIVAGKHYRALDDPRDPNKQVRKVIITNLFSSDPNHFIFALDNEVRDP